MINKAELEFIMEQIRFIVAIVLTMAILLGWQMFMGEKPQPTSPPTIAQQQDASNEPVGETASEIQQPRLNPVSPGKEEPKKPSGRIIEVQTPLYTVKLSEDSAVFESLRLSRYKETTDPDSPQLEMVDQNIPVGTIALNFEKALAMDNVLDQYSSDSDSNRIEVRNSPSSLSFRNEALNGVIITKTFTFRPDSYLIGMKVDIRNQTGSEIQDNLVLTLNSAKQKEPSKYGFEGPSGYINNDLENVNLKKLDKGNVFTGNLEWVAFQTRYFISCIIPEMQREASLRILAGNEKSIVETQYVASTESIKPEMSKTFDFSLYLGPKSISTLKPLGKNLHKAVDFGMFDFIARPFLWLMNKLHQYLPNYGVAIIILTLLIKFILWPLGSKSYKSMSEMKKIQPLMAEIREKYKDDKKRMNEEVMGLYRTYKINPMGGCLPMVVQIPVFFALYRMLYEAIELRHAPFFGWINDLSAPDRLFRFGFSIPFMEPPYGIPVLTIIMGASMFLQQKLSPPMGDPAQAKIMMLMPVIFTVIFINFSSGLVLYWLVNNIVSILQQYYIQKKYA